MEMKPIWTQSIVQMGLLCTGWNLTLRPLVRRKREHAGWDSNIWSKQKSLSDPGTNYDPSALQALA